MIYRDAKGRFCKKEHANSVMKGYKGFKPGLICQGKEYKENEIVSHAPGVYFCKNPLDVFRAYPPTDKECVLTEYAEVEALEQPGTLDYVNFCTTKLKVVRKLDFNDLIRDGIEYAFEHNKNVERGSGIYSIAFRFGGGVAVSNKGPHNVAAATGIYSVVTNSSIDYSSIVANNGNRSIASSNGDYNVTANTGISSLVNSNGYASITANTGWYSVAFSNNDHNIVASTGQYSAVSVSGIQSVAINTGHGGKVKGALGCWIACAEWSNSGDIIDFKSAYVDGRDIKADTWYRLENGKFVEI